MNYKEFIKQTIDFNKASYENGFEAILMIQDQTEKMTNTFLDQVNWFPKEARNSFEEGIKMLKKGQMDYNIIYHRLLL